MPVSAKFHQPALWLVTVMAVLTITACAREDDGLEHVFAGLPSGLGHYLQYSDDSTFVHFCRDVGARPLRVASYTLERDELALTPQQRQASLARLRAARYRLARVLATEFDDYSVVRKLSLEESLSHGDRLQLMELTEERKRIAVAKDVPAQERIEEMQRLQKAFEGYGDSAGVAYCKSAISTLCGRAGDTDLQGVYFRTALQDFQALRMPNMTCQLLGSLANYYRDIGRLDSMRYCFDRALEIAHRTDLPQQEVRITSFYAAYYYQLGRLALVHDLFDDAMAIAKQSGSPWAEYRVVREAANFHARLGCWQVVGQLLERLRLLDRVLLSASKYNGNPPPKVAIDLSMEGQLLMARGEVEAAEQSFQRFIESVEETPHTNHQSMANLYWSAGLVTNGEPQRALVPLANGLRLAEQNLFMDQVAKLLLIGARAYLDLDRLDEAEHMLDRYDETVVDFEEPSKSDLITRDALRCELFLARGEPRRAEEALEVALEQLLTFARSMDASTLSYLWLGEQHELRGVMHDVLADDPALGYGAELFWADLYRQLDANSRSIEPDGIAARSGPLIDNFRRRADSAARRISGLGIIHSSYYVRNGDILRWTVADGRIRCDTLRAAGSLRGAVERAWETISTDTNPLLMMESPELTATLRVLARELLPAEVLEAREGGPGAFLVSADGFLGRIPFEILDAGTGSAYMPLLKTWDVAYLRRADAPITGNSDVLVALTESGSTGDLVRDPPLVHARAEADAIVASVGGTVLSAASATKDCLLSEFENASFIYLLGHLRRDPEVPFLVYMPLRLPDGSTDREAGYLEIGDVRAANLSRCRIVVLPTCSSGVPYVDHQNSGPSMSDAFLDAGAGAVVQTFWDIRDDAAAELMTRFVGSWDPGASTITIIHKLGEARRYMMEDPNGVRHPSLWASYSLKVGSL